DRVGSACKGCRTRNALRTRCPERWGAMMLPRFAAAVLMPPYNGQSRELQPARPITWNHTCLSTSLLPVELGRRTTFCQTRAKVDFGAIETSPCEPMRFSPKAELSLRHRAAGGNLFSAPVTE